MGNLDNIQIVPGKNVPSHKVYRNNSQFNYIEFKNVETATLKTNPESSDTGRKKLCKLMRGKQSLLWIKSIGMTGGLSGNTEIVSPTDAEKYRDLPCCFTTPYGTLVPQVIIPTRNVIDNGMVYPVGIVSNISQDKKGGGYTWVPTKLNAEDYSGSAEIINECISSPLTYGERVPFYKCVTNEHSGKAPVDKPIFTTRKYTCDTRSGAAGSGSCAICYKFIKSHEIGDGITEAQKEQAPMIKIQLAGSINAQNESVQVNTIGAVIAKSGQLIGVVGENIGQGSMSEPSCDIMPPQCVKIGDKYDMLPLFMYPLYNGFVMTNSVIGNLKEGSNTVFIRYDDELQNPIYTARVNNVSKSDEMKQMDEVDDTSELMKWFPTLYQECSSTSNIRIKVPRSEKIDFADTVSLDWYKSIGRFAYCPIYFHRRIQLTYYFKGEYRSPDDSDGMNREYGSYKFYPLVCANIGESLADVWEGINSEGADCLTSVRHVIDDDELQESIYAVDLTFSCSSFQRYPIEIFGVVSVYERNDFQFGIENGNGGFVFDKDVIDTFTGFAKEQEIYSGAGGASDIYGKGIYEIEPPTDGEKNEWGGDKKFFPLISNLSVNAASDGVTGSMTLDGYPLQQGIKVFRQDQSIGEIDLAIVQNNVKMNLFSGYGMELSTNDGENNYGIGVNLVGVNRKLEDMRLICAPFWDGDRLEMICAYFEEYANIQIRMIDHTVTSYEDAKYVSTYPYSNKGTWESDSRTIVNSTEIAHPSFRVPRSCDWRSPSVNLNTGTTVLEALKTLGVLTGCVCIPQLDGTITYYELNNFGFPFYVDNQKNIVAFEPTDIISISLQPQLQNKYNSIATFGFLRRKNAEGKILAEENVQHGAFYSKTNGGDMPEVGVQFPWSRQSVGVESAMLTKMELAEIHANRIKMMTADIYLGNMTVRGNTLVNHIYQKINVCGQDYFVLSIEHSVDASSKVWTTSYQLQCINRTSKD